MLLSIPRPKSLLFSLFILLTSCLTGQNEAVNWYFGNHAGLSFSTTPPTVLSNGVLNTYEGSATISDSQGNLLFYTDGISVYNKQHLLMANGNGLSGNSSTTQSALIVKKPGSASIYYIFTEEELAGVNGLNYSEVDMSLAAGMGSVTIKNYALTSPSCEKLTGVQHCNGKDVWVITHDWGSNNFRTFLVTAAGVSLTPIISSSGSTATGNLVRSIGQMKASPNGKKLGLTVYDNTAVSPVEMHDFNTATGIVSNGMALANFTDNYGCEFSPDGTKFYSDRFSGNVIMQWDLCAGSNTAIVASMVTLTTSPNCLGQLQLAPDGKIYVARCNSATLSLINSPNNYGTTGGYTDVGQSIGTATSQIGLPNFVTSFFKPALLPFTHTVACSTASFNAPSTSTLNAGCTAVGDDVLGLTWYFGESISGAANTSALPNPSHVYSNSGTYTVTLVRIKPCGTDTLKAPVVISVPNVSVSGVFTVCSGDNRIYTATGADTYSWSNSATSASIAVSPTLTTSYSVTGTSTVNGCSANRIFTVNVNKCTGLSENTILGSSFRVYPNPVNNTMYVETEISIRLKLVDQLGQLLFEERFEKGKHNLDMTPFDKGIYFLEVFDNNTAKILQIVKVD